MITIFCHHGAVPVCQQQLSKKKKKNSDKEEKKIHKQQEDLTNRLEEQYIQVMMMMIQDIVMNIYPIYNLLSNNNLHTQPFSGTFFLQRMEIIRLIMLLQLYMFRGLCYIFLSVVVQRCFYLLFFILFFLVSYVPMKIQSYK